MRKKRNVFDDLGFSEEEATVLEIKARLHSQIVRRAKHHSQAELTKLLHEPQPRISDLMRGKIAKFSLEALIGYAQALHMRPEIRTYQPKRSAA